MSLIDKIVIYAAAIVALTSAIGCHEDSNPGQPQPIIHDNSTGLVPMKVGNVWRYRFYGYDTSGNVEATRIESCWVSRDTVIGDERWYRMAGFKPADVDFWDWYTNRSDGIWIRRIFHDSSLTYLTFRYPTQPGDRWGNVIGDWTRTLDTSAVTTTPVGIDTCIHYEDHVQFAAEGDWHYYIASGKGWTKLESFTRTRSGRLFVVARWVLQNFTIRE